MLTSEKFASKSNVDMRGRRVNWRPKNDLNVLYEMSDDNSNVCNVEPEEEKEIKIDLARGNGNITSSDEDSSSEWELEEVCLVIKFTCLFSSKIYMFVM